MGGAVIRAGRPVVDREGVARIHGYGSLRSAQRGGVFGDPTLPDPVNARGGTRRANRPLWDEQQIRAHHQGLPIPELPAEDHPDDLLDAAEASRLWGVQKITFDGYVHKHPHLVPAGVEVCGILHWRRGDLERFERPGTGSSAGRPRGTRDQRPRRRELRIEVRDVLARAHEPLTGYQVIKAISGDGGPEPSPQPVYQALQQLTADGHAQAHETNGRTVYRLTDIGRTAPELALQRRGRSADRVHQRVAQLLAEADRRGEQLDLASAAAELDIGVEHLRRVVRKVRDERPA